MIPMLMVLLTQKMLLMLNTITSWLNSVISTMMELLMLVNSTIVSYNVKTNGELNTVQISDMLIVLVHSLFQSVKVLGTVLILLPLLKIS